MTLSPLPPLSPKRSARRTARGLIALGLAAAAGLAGTGRAWPGAAAKLRPGGPPQAAAAVPDDELSDGFFWEWPRQLVAAAMFQCRPAGSLGGTQAAVVVWTDKANRVIAFGSARDGARLPAYAAALRPEAVVDTHQRVHVAKAGHRVRIAAKGDTLQLGGGMRLDCVRTWDD